MKKKSTFPKKGEKSKAALSPNKQLTFAPRLLFSKQYFSVSKCSLMWNSSMKVVYRLA
jgi:hypothetical protein